MTKAKRCIGQSLTALEIAEAELPGLPTTKRRVHDFANRHGWHESRLAREVSGRGGKVWLYDVRLLPIAARLELALKTSQGAEVQTSSYSFMPDSKMTEAASARLALLHQAKHFARQAGISQGQADKLFCEAVTRGRLTFDDWILPYTRKLSPRTLRRWRKGASHGEIVKGDARQNRKGTSILEQAEGGKVKAHILALIVTNQFLTAGQIRLACIHKFGKVLSVRGRAKPMPSERSFQIHLLRWKQENRNTLTALTNPDKYKGSIAIAGNNTAGHLSRINQLWEIDASPVDALCVDGRKNLYACIDVYSRRTVVLVTDEVSSAAVALLLRTALLKWGVPDTIKTDRGSDFASKATRRLIASLDIGLDLLPAGQPQMKPHVERFFRTLQHGFINALPGFIGHNVAERKVIEEQKTFLARRGDDDFQTFKADLTSEALQDHINGWLTGVYEQKRHGGLGCAPAIKAANCRTPIKQIEDVRALDLLLAPIAGSDGIRTITKKGIRLDGAYYFTHAAPVGSRVFCRHDPEDQGRLYLYDEDSESFLGDAVCPELCGLDPREVVREMKAAQRDQIKAMKSEIRAAKRGIKPRDVADALRGAAPSVVAFTPKSELHTSASLEAAQDALSGAPSSFYPDDKVVTLPKTATAISPSSSTDRERYNRAKLIETNLDQDRAVKPEDLAWLNRYQKTPEYRGFNRLFGTQQQKA